MTITIVRPEVLSMFVRFVRMNPQLAPDDECLPRVFAAYEACVNELDERDAKNHARDLRAEHDDGSWRDREAPRE